MVHIEESACDECGTCVSVCPENALILAESTPVIVLEVCESGPEVGGLLHLIINSINSPMYKEITILFLIFILMLFYFKCSTNLPITIGIINVN